MDKKADRFDNIGRIIRDFVKVYLDNPFNFLNEADVQSLLFPIIRDSCQDELVPMIGEHEHSDSYGPVGKIEINPVHREYPREHGKTGQFDIAIINKDKIQPGKNKKNDNFWYQPVDLAIEIKLTGPHLSKLFDDVKKINDYNKDNKLAVPGVVLQFIHPYMWGEEIKEIRCYQGKDGKYDIKAISADEITVDKGKVVGYFIGVTKEDKNNNIGSKRSYFKVTSYSAS